MSGATARATGAGNTASTRTPAQWYCIVLGAVLVLAGVRGFVANSSFAVGDSVEGDKLVLFGGSGRTAAA